MDALELFHPTIASWFAERLGEPSAPQVEGWPQIGSGQHVLIASPTGSGKTLAAFLVALDRLLRQGDGLPDECQVLYVSPLKALGNDVQKNLLGPLAELRERDESLPELRVAVRSGDTPQRERQAMLKRPPHVLVTTPESLYLLLTAASGAAMLRSVRTVIVDEIHAIADDKRGSHLALSLERLAHLCGEPQRIGLSATQRPIELVGQFLVGPERVCRIVDAGHLRELDLEVEVPGAPLDTVCSEDHWHEIVERVVGHVEAHRTTLVFTNTRKMAERMAGRLAEVLGKEHVTSHHGSLAKDRRLEAERRLKAGELKVLVATASLELGIDIGDVDLVIQIGVTASIATLLQRVGRAGHGIGRLPKGRVMPLTRDELVAAAALVRAVRERELDRLRIPEAPLDILAQQIVATCVQEDQELDELFSMLRRAWPYRELAREDFERLIDLHCGERWSLLHRDGVQGRLRATKRARLPAITSGGAIPDTAEYQVVLDPEGIRVGSVDEDFAIESTIGDVFQLGTASWRVLKIEPGKLRVADAQGAPPSMPFWFGEAPARSAELCAAIDQLRARAEDRAWTRAHCGVDAQAAGQIADYLSEGREALGAMPSRRCLVIERFFDESGGTQLVIHSPFGSRINRAYGLALRKRFCRGFGFELQAAADESAIVLSLGPMHSFPLEDVFEYLHPNTARQLLTQAVLPTPMFTARWRWNVGRALIVPRSQGGKRVPAPLLRMRADDALAQAFPEVVACGENLPPGDLPVPLDHPLVAQTIHDCLHEAMDVDGLLALLEGLRDGSIERVAVDRPTPSVFAKAILNAAPYSFLDDAPLEERRTQAVINRRALDPERQDQIGALDPEAVARVRAQAWPQPENVEELHEALCWMGFVNREEAERCGWTDWLDQLIAAGRVCCEDSRCFATEAARDSRSLWRGRLSVLGPVTAPLDDPDLLALENEGLAMRTQLEGHTLWCDRRLLARIQRDTLDRLRASIRPVSLQTFLRFLAARQHAGVGHKLEGPAGIAETAAQLSGLDVPAAAWEGVLRQRLAKYRSDWLDQLTLSGELCWLRLWGSGAGPIRTAPLSLIPRADLDSWLAWREPLELDDLGHEARSIHELLSAKGATFPVDLERTAGLLPSQLEAGLGELVGRGLASADSFAALRALCIAPGKRKRDALSYGVGRWSLIPATDSAADPGFALDRLLARYGVVFHRLLRRERAPLRWRDILREARARELRGDLRGGYFVEGASGEQFALPTAIPTLRKLHDQDSEPLEVPAADPLNLTGILTPDTRVAPTTRESVTLH